MGRYISTAALISVIVMTTSAVATAGVTNIDACQTLDKFGELPGHPGPFQL